MAHARAPPSPTPATLNDGLHPSLIGVAAAIEQSERDRKQRLGLAQELLGTIDAWAKTKAGTEDEAVLAPLIERLAPIMTAFAIGTAQTSEHPCKNQYPKKSVVTAAAPRVSMTAEKPTHGLPEKPQVTQQSWVAVARKAARLCCAGSAEVLVSVMIIVLG